MAEKQLQKYKGKQKEQITLLMSYFYLAGDQSTGCFIQHRASCCLEERVL